MFKTKSISFSGQSCRTRWNRCFLMLLKEQHSVPEGLVITSKKAIPVKWNPFALQNLTMLLWVPCVTYSFAPNLQPLAVSALSWLFFLNCGYSWLVAASIITDFSTLGGLSVHCRNANCIWCIHLSQHFMGWDRAWTTKVGKHLFETGEANVLQAHPLWIVFLWKGRGSCSCNLPVSEQSLP